MTQEETKHLGVKPTEKETVAAADPADKKTPDIVETIDSVLNIPEKEKKFDVETKDYDDDSVVISKADLETLKQKTEAGENYKQGLLSLKKNAKLVKPKTTKKEIPGDDKGYLEKDEFYGSIQKVAIKQACEDEDVNTHWAEIMPYYTARRGKTTSADIVEDINDAYTLFRKYHPKDAEETEDKDTVVELSNEKTEIKKGVNQGGKKTEKKTMFPKSEKVEDWYS